MKLCVVMNFDKYATFVGVLLLLLFFFVECNKQDGGRTKSAFQFRFNGDA